MIKILEEYKKKRNFERTREPSGSSRKSSDKISTSGSDYSTRPIRSGSTSDPAADKGIFVVQEHHARNLHWDFRLEKDGVLKSWAVPKGIPMIKGEKKLALAVEDHPLEYAGFQGEIEKGEYGAGKVIIWDKGTYNLIRREKDLWEIKLKGKKLTGIYVLFHPKTFEKNSWLIMKKQ